VNHSNLRTFAFLLSVTLAATLMAADDSTPTGATPESGPKLAGVPELLAQPEPPADRRYQYGPDEFQFADLRLPEGEGPFPVVVLVHGGCWLAQYGIGHIGAMAQALTDAGVATWALEFRRIGNEGGAWPGTFLDVANGTDFLREVAAENNLDLNRVVVSGHSAGGHLALWLAARHQLPVESELYIENPLALAGVVALAPAADLELTYRNQTCGEAAQKLIGGTPEEYPQRYNDGSAAALLPLGIPQVIVNGDHDEGWLIVSRAYQAKAASLGETVEIIIPPDAGHFELVMPASNAFDLVRKTILAMVPPADPSSP
jgi:acetyl esterase/lipase